jgi:hypothetical protein
LRREPVALQVLAARGIRERFDELLELSIHALIYRHGPFQHDRHLVLLRLNGSGEHDQQRR